jgi:hypothetical protein
MYAQAWTPRGAHLLLQVRANVLNNDLQAAFRRWHPGFGGITRSELAAYHPRIWLHSMGSLERHIRVGTRLHHSARSAATAVLDL